MICLPFVSPEIGGGGYGFLKLFERWLTEHQIPWHRSLFKPADVLFVNSWHTSPRYVHTWKLLHRGKVVHRVDGWAHLYGRADKRCDERQWALFSLADHVIFQSQYAWQHTWARQDKYPPHSIIHNPVDLTMFTPEGQKLWDEGPHPRVACVSWSDNPKKGGPAIERIIKKNTGVTFFLIGRWPIREFPNARKLGVLQPYFVACALRSCDALLTMSENEACPNHVLEAMACGLPVLYRDSGATRELVEMGGLATTGQFFDDDLECVTTASTGQYARLRAVGAFSPDVIFPKYLEAMGCA